MEKFDSKKHKHLISTLPFSYFSTDIFLDECAYVFKRNDEDIVVWQDILFPHDFPSLFLPKKKKNWQNMSVAMGTKEDVDSISKEGIQILLEKPLEQEYFYTTEDLVTPDKKIKRRIQQFTTTYKHKLLKTYPKKKVLDFFEFWKKQRPHTSMTFDESGDSFLYCVSNLKKYKVKQLYVEVDGKLAGLAFAVEHSSGNWVGLHLKVDYSYKGLSRFLHNERAKLFSDKKLFTLGTSGYDLGIAQFKSELGPSHVIHYSYVLTGGIN